MTLADWARNGWLRPHQPSASEIRDLLAVVERDLRDSAAPAISSDWRLNIAYNAALQAATAALAASGYRASREQHHYRVIHSLVGTIGADAALVILFDAFRKKRNTADYERAGTVSDTEATEMRSVALRLRDAVVAWLRRNHPDLLADT